MRPHLQQRDSHLALDRAADVGLLKHGEADKTLRQEEGTRALNLVNVMVGQLALRVAHA